MQQVAIFVDAGYLFAAGSAVLAGTKQPREEITLDQEKVVAALMQAAETVAPSVRLLRIYWYDGIRPYQSPSAQQTSIGLTANVKLRLGMINSFGQQKGVDALIVTDMIDLARNQAISDALVVAGDEDVRVGVQVAQTFGVRVHLLGIEPSRANQSPHLVQEVDSHLELDKATVSSFMGFSKLELRAVEKPIEARLRGDVEPGTDSVIPIILERFSSAQLADIKQHIEITSNLPREVDAPILAEARKLLNRDLDNSEKRELRKAAKARIASAKTEG